MQYTEKFLLEKINEQQEIIDNVKILADHWSQGSPNDDPKEDLLIKTVSAMLTTVLNTKEDVKDKPVLKVHDELCECSEVDECSYDPCVERTQACVCDCRGIEKGRNAIWDRGPKGPETPYIPLGEDVYNRLFKDDFENEKKEPGGDGWLLIASLTGLALVLLYTVFR